MKYFHIPWFSRDIFYAFDCIKIEEIIHENTSTKKSASSEINLFHCVLNEDRRVFGERNG